MSRFITPAFRTEARENLELALPLIGAQIAAVGMGTVDTIFAGRLGPQALAAVAVGVNINVLFLVFFMGLLMACSPIVAQMVGAKRPTAEIGGFMRRARRFALVCGVLWALLLNLVAEPVLSGLNLAPETTRQAIVFERWLSASGIGTSLWFCLRFSAEGVGQVKPIVRAGLTGLAANIVMDWLFVFGNFGVPKLGVLGFGLATTVSSALMAAVLWLQYRRIPELRLLSASAAVDAGAEGGRDILRLGLPIALIILAEGGLFVLTSLLMARFGDAVVAAYQVAINFCSLVFMIPLGVAMATTVRVGHAAGAGDHAAARYRGSVGIRLGGFNAASNAAMMLLFPLAIVSFYTEDAAIRAQAAGFLLLAAAFQLFDGVQATASGALRGLKDTRVPMVITLVAYWLIGMPVAWWLAFHLHQGPPALWWGLTAGLGVAALGLTLRFQYKSRKTLRLSTPSMGDPSSEVDMTKSHNSMPIGS